MRTYNITMHQSRRRKKMVFAQSHCGLVMVSVRRHQMPATYICNHCGQEHEGLPTDWGYKLPDDVHALSYLDRYLRSRSNRDLCTLDEGRYFFRALLPIRLSEQPDNECFTWGVWVEVDKSVHDLYLKSWDEDITNHLGLQGRLANDIKVHPGSTGLPVEIQFQPDTDRPKLKLLPEVLHALAIEQRNGISGKRHHDILVELGHFGAEDDA